MKRISASRVVGTSVAAALLISGVSLFPAFASDYDWSKDAFRGQVQAVPGDDGTPEVLDGVVFEDTNRNSVRDEGEPGIAGVAVSNGRDVVLTDSYGAYEIPVAVNDTVFMSQPSGYAVPVDADNIPQFSYTHLPEGSPYALKFGGLAPTGPLPDAVNFPVVKSDAHASGDQNFVVATDVQTRNDTEVGYAARGAIADLAKRTDYSSAGVLFTGDFAYDNLAIYPAMREHITGAINGPAWVVPGNHDMDFDSPERAHAFDTYRSHFGPESYSFNVGDTHVIQMQDIDYPVGKSYNALLSEEQLAWLEADLAVVPMDKTIIFTNHIPLTSFADASSTKHQVAQLQRVWELLEGRTAMTVGGHTHSLENYRAGDKLAEWTATLGIDELPFPHVVAGAVSGAWYTGQMQEEGYPISYQRDGVLPGVVTLEVRDGQIRERFTARGMDDSVQMNTGLNTPYYRDWWEKNRTNRGKAPEFELNSLPQRDLAESYVTVNFWMGGTGDVVEVAIDGGPAIVAERTQPMKGESVKAGAEWSDPLATYSQFVYGGNNADRAMHIWRAPLPTDLAVGEHTVDVTATDIYGRVFTDKITINVREGGPTFPKGDIPVTAEIPGADEEGTEGAGVLALSIEEGSLNLADARNAGDRLRLGGVLPAVKVTDSRTEGAGWNLTGTASDLVSGEAKVRAANLGWAPFLVDGKATLGETVKSVMSGGAGLGAPARLANSAEVGSASVAADVNLEVPVDTKAGTYTGGITVSLFAQD